MKVMEEAFSNTVTNPIFVFSVSCLSPPTHLFVQLGGTGGVEQQT